jgi:tetratricopeptide (TPR) repeat protein
LWLAIVAGVAAASLVYDPSATAAHPKRVAGLLVALVAVVGVLAARARGQRLFGGATLSPALAGWLAFVVVSGVSMLWGKPAGLDDAMGWVAAAGIALAAGALPPRGARAAALSAGWWVGSVSAVAVLAQWMGGTRGIALHGGHGNGNWLGLVLAVTLPLSAGFAKAARDRRAPWWAAAVVGVGLQLPALVLASSRVAWVAWAASIGVAAWLALPAATRWRRLAGATVVVLVLAATWTMLRFDRGNAAGEDATASIAGRMWIWNASLDAGKTALPLGTGLGGFAHAYLDAQGTALAGLPVTEASRRFQNATTAHQEWIQALVETGPSGLSLLALALGSAMLDALRRRDASMTGTWVALIVCCFGDSPLRQPAIVLLMGLCFAAQRRRWWKRATPALGATFVASSMLLAVGVAAWLACRWETAARDALPGEQEAGLERAVQLDDRSGQAALSLGLLWLETGDARGALTMLAASRDRLANVGTDVAMGNAWMQLGEPAKAERSYERALQRHPGSFRAHANQVEALRAQGKLEEAEQHLAVARRLYPGHPKLSEMEEALRRARQDREAGGAP